MSKTGRTAFYLILGVGSANQRSERLNETWLDPNRPNPIIPWHTRGRGESAVIDIEFDQGLGMLGNKRDRRYDNRNIIPACSANFIIGRRSDPFQRSDPTLITHLPVEHWPIKSSD